VISIWPVRSQAVTAPVTAPPSCDQVLSACDRAVNDAEAEIDAKKLLIIDLQTQNTALSNQNTALTDSAGAFYHNPVTMVVIGLVVGVLAGVYVKH